MTLSRRSVPRGHGGPAAAGTATPEQSHQFVEEFERYQNRWYTETLPMITASLRLALEVYDTFGPGMTRIDNATEAAIWNNKHHVWVTEFGGAYPDEG